MHVNQKGGFVILVVTSFLLTGCASLSGVWFGDNKAGSSSMATPPKLSTPRYQTIWVPDKIEGTRYIEGHRIHIIEEAGRWISEK